jgi:hypothetical protein
MDNLIDAMNRFFWKLVKITFWVLTFVMGWIIGYHILDNYL